MDESQKLTMFLRNKPHRAGGGVKWDMSPLTCPAFPPAAVNACGLRGLMLSFLPPSGLTPHSFTDVLLIIIAVIMTIHSNNGYVTIFIITGICL